MFTYQYDGCYHVTPITYSWFDAIKACALRGADLVTVTSYEQNRWVAELIDQRNSWSWIGLSEVGTSQLNGEIFQWINGAPVAYTNWQSGQPNNQNGQWRCGAMLPGSGQWEEFVCANTLPAICKRNTTKEITRKRLIGIL